MKKICLFLVGMALFIGAGVPPTHAAEPVVTALVIDTSGSVKAALGRGRDLAVGILAGLPPGSEVAVFTFDDQSRLLLPRTQQPDSVRRALSGVAVAGRHTALHDALYDASRYLREVGGRSAIVLITDGRDENSTLKLEDGLRLAEEARIPVFTVGVGRVEERILRRIAKLTGGQYVPIEKAKGGALATEIASTTTRLASSAPGPVAAPPTAAAAKNGAGTTPAKTGTQPASSSGKDSKNKAAQPGQSRGGGSFWIWTGLVLATGVGVAFFVVLRRRGMHRCATCGRELPNALASCAFCDAASLSQDRVGDRTLKADLSPTVLARLNETAEFLEKTVTLREKPVLNVTRGPGTGQLFELNQEVSTSIGRAKANDIVLQDVSISSQHCRILPDNGAFVLHDLQSTNGTFVNEKRVTEHLLADGDILQVGETFLQFHTEHRRV